jgi:hypothetical protein
MKMSRDECVLLLPQEYSADGLLRYDGLIRCQTLTPILFIGDRIFCFNVAENTNSSGAVLGFHANIYWMRASECVSGSNEIESHSGQWFSTCTDTGAVLFNNDDNNKLDINPLIGITENQALLFGVVPDRKCLFYLLNLLDRRYGREYSMKMPLWMKGFTGADVDFCAGGIFKALNAWYMIAGLRRGSVQGRLLRLEFDHGENTCKAMVIIDLPGFHFYPHSKQIAVACIDCCFYWMASPLSNENNGGEKRLYLTNSGLFILKKFDLVTRRVVWFTIVNNPFLPIDVNGHYSVYHSLQILNNSLALIVEEFYCERVERISVYNVIVGGKSFWLESITKLPHDRTFTPELEEHFSVVCNKTENKIIVKCSKEISPARPFTSVLLFDQCHS